jgi:hypothetical protein
MTINWGRVVNAGLGAEILLVFLAVFGLAASLWAADPIKDLWHIGNHKEKFSGSLPVTESDIK